MHSADLRLVGTAAGSWRSYSCTTDSHQKSRALFWRRREAALSRYQVNGIISGSGSRRTHHLWLRTTARLDRLQPG